MPSRHSPAILHGMIHCECYFSFVLDLLNTTHACAWKLLPPFEQSRVTCRVFSECVSWCLRACTVPVLPCAACSPCVPHFGMTAFFASQVELVASSMGPPR